MFDTVPVGAILIGWCTLMALAPLRRPRALAVGAWVSAMPVNELAPLHVALIGVAVLPGVISGDATSAGDRVEVALGALTVVGLLVVARRSWRARRHLTHALDSSLPESWRTELAAGTDATLRRAPSLRSVLAPWPVRPRSVERVSDVRYGPDPAHLLDVYRHRSRPSGAPTLIHLHGGRFRSGGKSREARPLLHHLASRGWTCISADYRLSRTPHEGFPGHLVDVKRVLAWVREHADEHGIDPDAVVLSGSSAGAHLTAMAALTAGDPAFQPGFEEADTTVAAAVGFYGYYGPLGAADDVPSTPLGHDAAGAPPFLVVHGTHDTYTPVGGARELARHLRAGSSNPVALAELPGAQHSFDVVRSVRYEAVVGAAEAFTSFVLHRRAVANGAGREDVAPTARGSRRAGARGRG